MFQKRKVIPDFGFINKVEQQVLLDFLFTEDGLVEISNNLGDTMLIDIGDGFDVWSGVQVFDEDTKVTQRWVITDKTGKTVAELYIIYDFVVLPDRVKITIEGKLDRKRRIKIPFKKIKREFYFDVKRLILWSCKKKDPLDEFFYGIGFDFSDIVKAGLSWKLDKKERVLYIDVPKHFKIDPTTVGLTTSGYATQVTTQRKTFYANGRYWVFYGDGTNIVYRTSTDALTWTDAIVIRAGDGREFSVWFDGTYLHYVYAPFDGTDIFYRMGTPNADGTITWLATEQSLGITNRCRYPTITTDSGGYPWVGWEEYSPIEEATYAKVSKSSTKDGTWTHATDFPFTLRTSAEGRYFAVVPVPLTASKMFVVYSIVGGPIYGREWTGAEFYPEELLSDQNINLSLPYCFSAVADPNDNIHIVYVERIKGELRYIKRPATTTIQASPTIDSGAWLNGSNAYASDNLYASTNVKGATHDYWGYDYSAIPVGANIVRMEIGVEAYGDGDDYIEIYASRDGGTTWDLVALHTPPTTDPDVPEWYEKIPPYTRDELQSPNFRVRVVYNATAKANVLYLDWIPTRVTYGPPPTETVLAVVSATLGFPTICIDEATGDLYVFWTYNNYIYYRKYDAVTDTWETTVDWITTENTITGNSQSCYWKIMNNLIGVVWTGNPTQAPPPLYVRHERYPPVVVPRIVVLDGITWVAS